ncbi:hypothetical protein AKJ62_00885 [candidate division MSBL1 archaeon SCGC-AAA259D14]|uniref:Uncharacterized protein n=1 Tax=candidate division MSBL1 archaeon SCGC-AAA259D14 TaxID=1698261 RepID=A0A133U8H7_9EURY|nr:hypothetical protein AKJ62_00885 [candidate division MSBL1 archaeon SCGC-AAA259D14]
MVKNVTNPIICTLRIITFNNSNLKVVKVKLSSKQVGIMKIKLPYGEGSLEAKVPRENLICVLEREKKKGIENYWKEILKGLRDPIGTPPLLPFSSFPSHRPLPQLFPN